VSNKCILNRDFEEFKSGIYDYETTISGDYMIRNKSLTWTFTKETFKYIIIDLKDYELSKLEKVIYGFDINN
jgi:hypothetical protein